MNNSPQNDSRELRYDTKLTAKELVVWFLARNRRTFFARYLLKIARAIVKGLENYCFNIRLNGEKALLHRLKDQNFKVIFDVGANRGNWAAAARLYFANADIHCFELAPPTFSLLSKRLEGDSKVFLNCVGLSDTEKEIEFSYGDSDDGHTSILSEQYAKGVYSPMKGILDTGAAYCEKCGITSIDILKLDVEGVEHLTLKGFEPLLASGGIKVIQFEYSRYSVMTGFLLKDFYLMLNRYGYVVGKIFPHFVDFKPFDIEDEDFLGPNYLAVRKDLTSVIQALS